MRARRQTKKRRVAQETNWLIYRLRGYETLLEHITLDILDEEVLEQADAALDLTRNLIYTIKTNRRTAK